MPKIDRDKPLRRISVCGKGGSGKSTVVALLSDELSTRGWRVIVVDSDESNACLHWMLGLDRPPRPLVELIGGRDSVRQGLREPRTDEEAAEASVLARPEFTIADLPRDCLPQTGDRVLVTVGKIHQALEGCACPLGVLNREFLHRLQLADDEMLLVDMEAGIEHFGRGIETSLDGVIVVVEPSLESVLLAEKIKSMARGSGANFAGAILNKIQSPDVEATLTAQLHGENVRVLGTVHYHPDLVRASLVGSRIPRTNDAVATIADNLLVAKAPSA